MSKSLIKTLSILGVFLIILFILFSSYISSYNYGNMMDNKIKSQYLQMENVLSQYYQKVQEMSQVPTMYKDDLKEIVTASIQGRYGKDGNKAMFQFIKEHNPEFDSSLYKKIQTVIEAGRTDFEFENKQLINIKNEYNIVIGSFYQGFWLRLTGFPKIDLDKYNPISTTEAHEVFQTGVEKAPLKLR